MARPWSEIPIYQNGPYPEDPPIEQYFASLWRQRKQGVPFETAHKQALAKTQHWHEHDARHLEKGLFADAGFVAIAQAAYERRSCPALDAFDKLGATLEADDDLPGYASAPTRLERRSGDGRIGARAA